jgi:hypothetical protein
MFEEASRQKKAKNCGRGALGEGLGKNGGPLVITRRFWQKSLGLPDVRRHPSEAAQGAA